MLTPSSCSTNACAEPRFRICSSTTSTNICSCTPRYSTIFFSTNGLSLSPSRASSKNSHLTLQFHNPSLSDGISAANCLTACARSSSVKPSASAALSNLMGMSVRLAVVSASSSSSSKPSTSATVRRLLVAAAWAFCAAAQGRV